MRGSSKGTRTFLPPDCVPTQYLEPDKTFPPCPICLKLVWRAELEGHILSCMTPAPMRTIPTLSQRKEWSITEPRINFKFL